jgi:hypothetical protein
LSGNNQSQRNSTNSKISETSQVIRESRAGQ